MGPLVSRGFRYAVSYHTIRGSVGPLAEMLECPFQRRDQFGVGVREVVDGLVVDGYVRG
jgi:hypothetical protein